MRTRADLAFSSRPSSVFIWCWAERLLQKISQIPYPEIGGRATTWRIDDGEALGNQLAIERRGDVVGLGRGRVIDDADVGALDLGQDVDGNLTVRREGLDDAVGLVQQVVLHDGTSGSAKCQKQKMARQKGAPRSAQS